MLSSRLNKTLSLSTDISNLQMAIFPNVYMYVNAVTITLFLPLVNHILVPCIPSMTIREKIGIGMAITIVGVSVSAYLEWTVHDLNIKPLYSALLLMIPTILLAIQEVFSAVSGKCNFYL